jgi:hypothetical protein
MIDKLPYKEDVILELTNSDELVWEVKTRYLYEMGSTEPIDKVIDSAQTTLRSFILDYDGTNMLYFRYRSLNLGYMMISPELQKAIEESGERLIKRLNSNLGLILE